MSYPFVGWLMNIQLLSTRMKTLLFSMLKRIQFELVEGSEDIRPTIRHVILYEGVTYPNDLNPLGLIVWSSAHASGLVLKRDTSFRYDFLLSLDVTTAGVLVYKNELLW